MDRYLAMRINKRDNYGQPVNDPQLLISAAIDFLEKTKGNEQNFQFCLSYLLRIAGKEHKDHFFLALYDAYLQTREGDCGDTTAQWAWVREKASILRGVQTGSIAPDFALQDGILNLSSIKSDYTLLVFWATWCPYCTQEMPGIKNVAGAIADTLQKSGKRLTVIAISLDTDKTAWQQYVEDNNLNTTAFSSPISRGGVGGGLWLNFSELKGWKGDVPKRYNVYATPTMFLLNREKKIIARPENAEQLFQFIPF